MSSEFWAATSLICLALFNHPGTDSNNLALDVKGQAYASHSSHRYEPPTDPIKSLNEIINDYFIRYPKDRDQKYNVNFIEHFKVPLLMGSSVFRVSPQLTACLLLRESQWDEQAHSSADANGFIQVRTIAIQHINQILKSDPLTRTMWRQYLTAFSVDGPQDYYPGKKGGSDEIEIPLNEFYSIELGFAMHFVLIRDLSHYLDHRLDTIRRRLTVTTLDKSLMIAMAYNLGEARFGDALEKTVIHKKYRGQSYTIFPADWFARLDIPIETRRQGLAQLNCMQRGNMRPPPGY